MTDYPRTIESGGGERITFLRRVQGATGEVLELEARAAPGSGPPMHVHYRQEEAFTVRKGRLAYQHPGEAPVFVGEGEHVVFKAGQAHRFWNAGDEELEVSGYVAPPNNVEYFLTALYASTKRNGGKRPDLFDAAFLSTRYRSEFAMVEIPAPVRGLLFPVQVAIGTLLGKFRKYADAPPPLPP